MVRGLGREGEEKMVEEVTRGGDGVGVSVPEGRSVQRRGHTTTVLNRKIVLQIETPDCGNVSRTGDDPIPAGQRGCEFVAVQTQKAREARKVRSSVQSSAVASEDAKG